MNKKDKTTYGLIISALAFCVSWYFNHSVAWGIFHALMGGLYLAYKAAWFFVVLLMLALLVLLLAFMVEPPKKFVFAL